MSSTLEITPGFFYDIWLQRIAIVAGYTLLVYDYFLTLSDEVECVWKAPWTLVKFIYLANRYIVLLGQTLVCIQATGLITAVNGGCEVYALFLGVYLVVTLEIAHVLVVLRAWAVWGGDRRILWSVVVIYAASLVSIVAVVSKGEDLSNFDVTVTSFCYKPVPDRAWLFYLASLVVDSLLFCMTMMGLWSYRKTFNNGYLGLIQVLMRGATAFYFVNVCYGVLGIVSWTIYRNSPKSFAITAYLIPMLAICGQRVVHDLRRAAPMSCSTQNLSQVVDRQVNAFAFWSSSADEGAFMALERDSDLAREATSNVDEIGTTDDDCELQLDDDAVLSMKAVSFESRPYPLARNRSVGMSVPVQTGD
ncbi:hypothetical protein EDC04DRAFT_2889842 [Pisolithus marmoratus]|nr:hypothetical protein EDC04DRAFT_2889842 [Pisolithus marmoratus]